MNDPQYKLEVDLRLSGLITVAIFELTSSTELAMDDKVEILLVSSAAVCAMDVSPATSVCVEGPEMSKKNSLRKIVSIKLV